MSLFTIEMLPAGYGDALWVEYGTERSPRRLLIDGGLSGTFDAICSRAEQAARPTGRCDLELLVITHVDTDHIAGVVKLLANLPSRVRIEQVWFNGWSHLPAPPTPPRRRLGPPHGEMLSVCITQAKLTWNTTFDGGPVAVQADGTRAIRLPGGLKVTVLSPTLEALAALRPKWAKACRDAGIVPGSVASGLRALRKHRMLRPRRLGAGLNVRALARAPIVPDTAVTNASSIALLLEYDGRRCLLAGDAHPEALTAAVRSMGRGRGLRLDAFKLSHHGSQHNTSRELLEAVACPRFLFSTNGATGHPDPETVARVIDTAAIRPLELCFNYPSLGAQMDGWNDARLRRRWEYVLTYPDPNGPARVAL